MFSKKQHILITAGGTIVAIDDVRHIGNFSTGSFPAKIAKAALAKGFTVTYLHATHAKVPPAHKRLTLVPFETYDDYAANLKRILKAQHIGIAFLAAAVSDYGVKSAKGKISSSRATRTLHLTKLPKLITQVKIWSRTPLFQVGFKLLSNVSQEQLVETAYVSGLKSRSDLTVANDLARLHAGHRESVVVTPERGVILFSGPTTAKSILNFAIQRAQATHFKTVVTKNLRIASQYRKEIILFARLAKQLAAKGHMPDFHKGAISGHGSLALRTTGNAFLITARGSNKKHLTAADVVLVTNVDQARHTIHEASTEGKKASLNAPLVTRILQAFPKVNAVVHTHRYMPKAPYTSFPYTPGTQEYATAPLKLLAQSPIVNLAHHGLIAVGDDITETVSYVLR